MVTATPMSVIAADVSFMEEQKMYQTKLTHVDSVPGGAQESKL